MSAQWEDLLAPVSDELPGGEDLEDSPLLASVEAYRVFGSAVPHSPEPEWVEIRKTTLDGLAKSKDLLLLVHLGTAALRTDGLPAFLETLTIAAHWLESHWEHVYPRVEEDAVQRINALNCFADRMAVLNALRRVPFVSSRQHGAVSLRDCRMAAGQAVPEGEEAGPSQAQIDAAFADTPGDELERVVASAVDGVAALQQMDAVVRDHVGDGLDVAALAELLGQIASALRAQLAKHPDATATVADTADDAESEGMDNQDEGAMAVGAIRNREDAIRALDAVAEFFRRNEPSSPIPLFVERAKGLVSKSFLEVLADVAPDGLAQAKTVGGVDGTES